MLRPILMSLAALAGTAILAAGCGEGSDASDDGGTIDAAGSGGGAAGGSGAGGAAGAAGNSGAGGGEPGVQLLGRFEPSGTSSAKFGWSGCAIVARFQGTGVQVRLDGSPNFFAIVVDGGAPTVLKTTGATTPYTVASGLASGVHEITIWRRTEGNQGENTYVELTVQGGQLLATPRPSRRIEVYGDSISAGYGMDGVGPSCPYSADTENHYLTYEAIAARALGAEVRSIAVSGIGMYRNYGQSGASANAMPSLYARTLPTIDGSSWDFSTWQPDVVVINLGTNDFSSGDPGTPFRTTYLDFVRSLRQKYPSTFFVLSIGPMLDGANLTAARTHLQAVISTRSGEGDKRMSYLEFPVQQQADGYGCDWHPSAKTNAKMAVLLEAELKARLSW